MWCAAWRSLRGTAAATTLVAIVFLCADLAPTGLPLVRPPGSGATSIAADSCTVFSVTQWDTTFVGNNEDYTYAESYYWVEPGDEGEHGALYLGLDDIRPRGGVNEHGLCFDATGLPDALLNRHWERPSLDVHFPILAMRHCGTVQEVIDLSQRYDWGRYLRYQVLFADASGDAVVIGPGPDGELAFTRKNGGNGYLVATNFNRANRRHGDYPCERYETCVVMLEGTKKGMELTLELCRDILHSVSQREAASCTLYSNVIDPSNGLVYLYYHRQYDEVAILNVAAELSRGKGVHKMRDLFSEETVVRGESAAPKCDSESVPLVVVLLVGSAGLVGLAVVLRVEVCGRCSVGGGNSPSCQPCLYRPLHRRPVLSLRFRFSRPH
ncbi:MAG: hypothetical protein JW846_08475 [Dehalococcoidia bacterium]|nr:hypothetical protein [Dehalococcoidia bacterium]